MTTTKALRAALFSVLVTCGIVSAQPALAAGQTVRVGIMSGEDAKAKIAAGATLVQIHTGLVYRGPGLVAEIADALAHALPGASTVKV